MIRATIMAMREPTWEMLEAGLDEDVVADQWRAMVIAASMEKTA